MIAQKTVEYLAVIHQFGETDRDGQYEKRLQQAVKAHKEKISHIMSTIDQ